MSPPKQPDDLPEDVDADAILKRRDFLIRSAMVAGGAVLVGACTDGGDESDTSQPEVCLSVDVEDTSHDAETFDTEPQVCLTDVRPLDTTPDVPPPDTEPEICLSPPIDVDEGNG